MGVSKGANSTGGARRTHCSRDRTYMGNVQPLKGDSKQEVVVNFVAQDSVAIASDSLQSTVGKLWDLDSIGIKASDKVHESFENDISFLDDRYSVKLPWRQGHEPFPAIMETVYLP